MSLRAILLPASALLLAFAPPIPTFADEPAALKKLEGTWKAVQLVNDGQSGDVEKIRDQRLVIQGHHYTLKQAEGNAEGTLRLDPDHDPSWMSASYTTKEGEKGAVDCIYKIEGDRLTICWGQGERPSTFSAESGSGYRLMVFEREK